jgi:hypothetical protein
MRNVRRGLHSDDQLAFIGHVSGREASQSHPTACLEDLDCFSLQKLSSWLDE